VGPRKPPDYATNLRSRDRNGAQKPVVRGGNWSRVES
jgi:hypothetical protein